MEDIGRQPGAVGLDLEGNSVVRDADGKLHILETAEQLKTRIRPSFSIERIEQVLDGRLSFSELSPPEQAYYRAGVLQYFRLRGRQE